MTTAAKSLKEMQRSLYDHQKAHHRDATIAALVAEVAQTRATLVLALSAIEHLTEATPLGGGPEYGPTRAALARLANEATRLVDGMRRFDEAQ